MPLSSDETGASLMRILLMRILSPPTIRRDFFVHDVCGELCCSFHIVVLLVSHSLHSIVDACLCILLLIRVRPLRRLPSLLPSVLMPCVVSCAGVSRWATPTFGTPNFMVCLSN